MSTAGTLPPRAPCCFTAPFLCGRGEPEEMEALSRAGEILFRDRAAADLPPGNAEPLESALRRRLLLAANDLEALATWLAMEFEFSALDTAMLAYLGAQAAWMGAQLRGACESLRLAVLANDETALRWQAGTAPPPAAGEPGPGPVAAYQQLLAQLAATARGWMSEVRRAAATLEPLLPPDEQTRNAHRESKDYEPLALELFDSGDHLAEEIAGLVALLTVYAEATEDRRTRLARRDVARLARQIYEAEEPSGGLRLEVEGDEASSEENGAAPGPSGEPEGGDRG